MATEEKEGKNMQSHTVNDAASEFGVGFTEQGEDFCLVKYRSGASRLWHELDGWHHTGAAYAPDSLSIEDQHRLARAHLAHCPVYQARLAVAERGGAVVMEDDGGYELTTGGW